MPTLASVKDCLRRRFATATAGSSNAVAISQDPYEVTDQRARCLAEMINHPTRSIQRFVEHLSFVPDGGLRWERTLQLQLPASKEQGKQWWIVPLGPFNRRRFADIIVLSPTGEPLNLVTRDTHGEALTKATFANQLLDLSPRIRKSLVQWSEARKSYSALRAATSDYYTDITDTLPAVADLSLKRTERKSVV